MFEIRSKGREFDRRLERLGRYDRSLAMELVHLMYEELQVNGCVPSVYRPHVLDNPGGRYNGCVEFHLADDVLVIYWPPKPDQFIRMLDICTHEELRTGRYSSQWPHG